MSSEQTLSNAPHNDITNVAASMRQRQKHNCARQHVPRLQPCAQNGSSQTGYVQKCRLMPQSLLRSVPLATSDASLVYNRLGLCSCGSTRFYTHGINQHKETTMSDGRFHILLTNDAHHLSQPTKNGYEANWRCTSRDQT